MDGYKEGYRSDKRKCCSIECDYSTFHLSMDCFWCEVLEGELKLLEAESARWLTKETLYDVQCLPADTTLIVEIEKHMP